MLRLTDNFRLLGRFGSDSTHLSIILCVKIAIILRDVDINFAAWFQIGGWKLLGFVIALGTPSNVVSVAESVDVEDVDVGRCEEEILEKL